MDKLKEATIAVYHHDCYCSKSTEKFPEISLNQESPVVYISKKENRRYQILWSVSSNSKSELDAYFKYLKNHPLTNKMIVLNRSPTTALFFHRTINQSSSYESVLKNDVVYSSAIKVEDGLEIHDIIAMDPKNMQKTLRELESIGETKILRLGDYKPKMSKYCLTKKQKRALAIALDNGYYGWPKNVNLDELAAMEKISRRSLQERLRRAESKIIPNAIEDALKG
jgi:predicted DNA binding protein